MSNDRGKPPVPMYSMLPQPRYTPLENQRRDGPRDEYHQRPYEPRHEQRRYEDIGNQRRDYQEYGSSPYPFDHSYDFGHPLQHGAYYQGETAYQFHSMPNENSPYQLHTANEHGPEPPRNPLLDSQLNLNYEQCQSPSYSDMHRREPYRDPAFDYQKSVRYEPPREELQNQARNDPTREPYREQYHWDHQKRHDGYSNVPRGVGGGGKKDYLWIYHDGQDHSRDLRDRYNVPAETNSLSTQQHDQQDYYDSSGYDRTIPAGLANKYDVKITDLLTSVMDKTEPSASLQQIMEENKGYLVLARFNKDDISTVVNAIQTSIGVLSSSYSGYVIGFAEPEDITVSVISNYDRIQGDNSWFSGPRYAACCFWFKHIKNAKDFFEGTNPFKQHDFPSFGKLDIIGVPLTYGRNPEPLPLNPENSDITLMWTEFPSISERGPNDFLYNYSEPVRQLIREHGGHPNVSISKVKTGWPADFNKFGQDGYRVTRVLHDRVGRNLRNGWLRPESFVTVSAFPTREQVVRLFRDPRFNDKRTILQRYTRPTILGITLRTVRGTRRTH